MNDKPTRSEIAELVRQHIAQRKSKYGFDLSVLAEEIWEEEGTWNVPVHPTIEPDRMTPYYDLINEVEDELRDSRKIDVFIVPSSVATTD